VYSWVCALNITSTLAQSLAAWTIHGRPISVTATTTSAPSSRAACADGLLEECGVFTEAVLPLGERGCHPIDVDVRHPDDPHGESADVEDPVRVVQSLVGLPVVEVVRENRGVEVVHQLHEVAVLGGLVRVVPVPGT